MAKKSLWQRVKKKVKEWASGGESSSEKSTSKSTPPKPRAVATNRDARNQTVSSGFNKRAFVTSLNDSKKEKKEEDRVREAFKASKYSYANIGDFDKVQKERKDARDAYKKEYKAEQKELRRKTGTELFEGSKEDREQALVNLLDPRSRHNPEARKFNTKYHKYLESAERGVANAASLYGVDIMMSRIKDPEQRAAEEYYQKNKSRGAEILGDVAGSIATFGGVGKAVETPVAKAIGSKAGQKAVGKLAEGKLLKATAKRVTKKTAKKLGKEASEEAVKAVARRKAEKIASGVATSALIDATAGNVMNINLASKDHEVGSKEWWDAYKQYTKWNAALSGAVSLAPAIFGGGKIAAEELRNLAAKKAANRNILRGTLKDVKGVSGSTKATPNLTRDWESLMRGVNEPYDHWVARVGEKNVKALQKRGGQIYKQMLAELGGDEVAGTVAKNADEAVGMTVKGTKPAAKTLRATEEVAERATEKTVPSEIEALRQEMDEAYEAINKKGISEEERLAISERYYAAQRRLKALEEGADEVVENVAPAAEATAKGTKPAAEITGADAPLDDVDALLDEMIQDATTVDDFMALGLSRPEAEILAESKAKVVAAEDAAGKITPPTKRGLPKGNIRSIEETLGANEFLPRNRNAQYVRAPRSAKRVDTSIEGLTKRLEELRSRVPQTDKERRALQTEINEVEDLLNRTKWRKEGGANMDAMRKAYGGEYAGFDMSKSTNSYQSDALEGKIKGKTATIVEMSPDEYMERAYRQIFKKPSGKGAQFAEIPETSETVAKYAEAMRNGEKFPLPYLDYTNAGQEGRHRALAAKQAGIDRIPVVVIDDAANPKAIIDDIAEAAKGTKQAAEMLGRNADEAAAETAKGTKQAAESLAPKNSEQAWEEKRKGILESIGEDENGVPSLRQREYTIKAKYKSGKTYTKKIRAYSDAEALDEITKNKGVDSATIVSSSEINPDAKAGLEPKSAKLTSEEKADNIRAALAEDTAKGTTPAAATLEPKAGAAGTEPPRTTPPKDVDDLDNYLGVKHEKVSNKEKFHDVWSYFRTKFVDSLDAYERWNKQFLKNDYGTWESNNGAIDKFRRHQAVAAKSVSEGQVGWNYEDLGKSVKEIYDGLDAKREKLFEKYLVLKHAPERIAAEKPIYKGKFADPAVCEQEAQKILEANPDFADRANYVYKYFRNEIQNRVNAGLLEQEVADEWFKKYPNYVPTGRVGNFQPDEDIWDLINGIVKEKKSVGASEIKAATKEGSDLPIRSIKEQMAETTTRNWRDMSMNNLFRKMFGDKTANYLAAQPDGGIGTVLDNTINVSKTGSGKNGRYFAKVFVDGKEQRFEIDKRFYDGIEDLLKNGRLGKFPDFIADVASVVTTPFKKLITTWNPIFMVKNGERDFPEAIINSRYTKEFMGNMGDALSDLYGSEGGGMWTRALRKSGVSQANFINLEEALVKERKGLVGLAGKGANKFATLQESVETYPRLVEFMATIENAGYDMKTGLPTKVVDAIKKDFGYDLRVSTKNVPAEVTDAIKSMGYDLSKGAGNVPMDIIDRAAANAADVTVNFGRSGSISKNLNRGILPFFNPSVQGFDKFVRNFSSQPSTKKLLETILKAGALGAGATAINNYLLGDNPFYQQIAAREKATNYIIACPFKIEDGKVTMVDGDEANVFIKIPKSRFAAVYSEPTVNVANQNKMGWAEMIKVAKDQIAPVDPMESSIFASILDATKTEQGETWYGSPIVPESLMGLEKWKQYDANTSAIGKAIGKATEKLPQELQISPKKADYVIDSMTGVIGDFVLPMTTPSRQGGGNVFGETDSPALNTIGRGISKFGTPIVNVPKRAFTIDANTQNDLSTRFYDTLGKANTKNNTYGGEAEKEEYNRLSSYSTEISGVNQAIRHLQNGKSETKQADIYELQKVRNQLMQDALDGKPVPTSDKMLDAVQKYVGTTYAVSSFGSSADKQAMKVYGEAKYGNLSDDEMQKKIDADKGFYEGVRAIGTLDDKMSEAGIKSNTVLSKAVALASVNADDDLFGAYQATKQSRTETADKMTRARNYFADGGSEDEFVQLETARKTMGKLSDYDKDAELDKIDEQLKNGEISYEEYYNKQGEIKYNANISRVGLATSLALANSPERAYRLYDIKDANIQKGINLAAMGYDARGYREMAKAIDTSGNGYLSRQEVVDYVANSGVADKATLFDALYPYQTKYNPFGTPTKYSIAQAAEMGRAKGFESIGGANNDFKISDSGKGNGNSYGGYGGYRHYKHYGHGGGGGMRISALPKSNYKASKQTYKDIASSLKTRSSNSGSTRVASAVKVEPPNVKFKKYEV